MFKGCGTAIVTPFHKDLTVNEDALRRLVRRHRESGACATLALRSNRNPAAYSPVVTDRRGRILSIAGRPAESRTLQDHTYPGSASCSCRRPPPTAETE